MVNSIHLDLPIRTSYLLSRIQGQKLGKNKVMMVRRKRRRRRWRKRRRRKRRRKQGEVKYLIKAAKKMFSIKVLVNRRM